MTMTELGAAFRPKPPPGPVDYGPLAGLVESMRAGIASDVLAALQDSIIATLADRLANLHVNVPTPVIHVDSPINLEAPEPASITLLGLQDHAGQVSALNTNVAVLIDLLSRPVVRTVTRDSRGTIERMTETRG